MKINKLFLSKIIKEEIKNILYEDNIEQELISAFIQYRNWIVKNPTKSKDTLPDLEKKLKNIAPSLSNTEILNMLEGKIDRQLFSFVKNILTRDQNVSNFSDKLDNYEMSISPDEQNVYQVYNKQDPDPGFMRVPKDDEAYDQEDVRKDQKTLVREELKKIFYEVIIESKLQDAIKINPENKEALNKIASELKIKASKYLLWSAKILKNNNIDVDELIEYIKKFEKNSPRITGKEKDINSYSSYENFKNVIDNLEPSGKETRKTEKSNSVKLFDDENFLVIRPLSTEASCYYGSNTKWCISGEEANKFNDYTRNNARFYFIINKKLPISSEMKKIAYTFTPYINDDMELEIFDSEDEETSRNDVKEIIGSHIEQQFYELMTKDFKEGKGSDIDFKGKLTNYWNHLAKILNLFLIGDPYTAEDMGETLLKIAKDSDLQTYIGETKAIMQKLEIIADFYSADEKDPGSYEEEIDDSVNEFKDYILELSDDLLKKYGYEAEIYDEFRNKISSLTS